MPIKKSDNEMEDINNKLQLSYIIDLKKPHIDRFERAKLLKYYIVKNTLSLQDVADRLNIGKTTVVNWLRWGDVDESIYKEMIDSGMTKSDVTNIIKGKKIDEDDDILELVEDKKLTKNEKLIKYFVVHIESVTRMAKKIKVIVEKEGMDSKTKEVVEMLRNELNYILYKGEINGKTK